MKRLVLQFAVVAICILLAGCNDDDSLFSTAQINQALLDMKGTYRGDASVSYYHGDDIADIPKRLPFLVIHWNSECRCCPLPILLMTRL